VAREAPEVMVLDLRMPGLDGLEVLRRVRRSHPQVQVIVLTGHGSDRDEEQARRLGAFEFLQKPVDIEDLVRTVRQAHRAAARDQGGTAPAGAGDGGADPGARGQSKATA